MFRLRMALSRRDLGALIAGACLAPRAAHADQPPAAPATFTVTSRGGRHKAVLEFPAREVKVFAVKGKQNSPLWTVPGWSPVAAVSDSGPTLAMGHPGNNLLPLNADEGTVIFSLYQQGRLVREVKLGEILPLPRLRRTISHVEWGTHVGFDATGRYRVEAVDKRVLAFP